MKATAKRVFGDADLAGRHVAISGVGKVGYALARHLVEERVRVTVADVNEAACAKAAKDFGAEVAPAEKIHAVDCDIYSPCALGGALTATTITELRCRAVVGSANNQLATPEAPDLLAQHGTVYAPDFIVNAGGVINIAEELSPAGYHRERAYAAVRTIFATTTHVLEVAEAEGITTAAAADRLAERRMAGLTGLGGIRHIRTFDRGSQW